MAVSVRVPSKDDPRHYLGAKAGNCGQIIGCVVPQNERSALREFGVKVLELFHELRVWRG